MQQGTHPDIAIPQKRHESKSIAEEPVAIA